MVREPLLDLRVYLSVHLLVVILVIILSVEQNKRELLLSHHQLPLMSPEKNEILEFITVVPISCFNYSFMLPGPRPMERNYLAIMLLYLDPGQPGERGLL